MWEPIKGNGLTRNSSGNACPQSAQLVQSLWTDQGLKSEIDAREMISTQKKKKKKTQVDNDSLNLPPKSSHASKKPPPPPQPPMSLTPYTTTALCLQSRCSHVVVMPVLDVAPALVNNTAFVVYLWMLEGGQQRI